MKRYVSIRIFPVSTGTSTAIAVQTSLDDSLHTDPPSQDPLAS